MSETKTYVEIFNGITSTPHRDYSAMSSVHQTACARSPKFYIHLGAWYKDSGVVRDHNVLFAATMITSEIAAVREVGLALARQLDPRNLVRVARLVNEFKGGKTDGRFVLIPRSLRTEIRRYLRDRENDDRWFDRTVVSNRRAMHDLYEMAHIRPGSRRAQAILFDDNPPDDSLPGIVKQIAKIDDPLKKAELAVNANLPYPILVSLLGNKLPTAMVALVNSMTPQQVFNNLNSLKKAGAMDNPDLRSMIQSKIKQSATDKRVSAGKVAELLASSDTDLDDEMYNAVATATTERVRAGATITKNTAILVDRSGSMSIANDVASQLFSMLATAMSPDAKLYAYAFDDVAYELSTDFGRIDKFRQDLDMIRAGGMTSYGIPIVAMTRKNQTDVEQLVFIGDEGENASPAFEGVYGRLPLKPNVVVVRIGQHSNYIENVCKRMGVEFQAIEFKGDKYSLQNVAALLSGKSVSELVLDILDYPLPQRMTA